MFFNMKIFLFVAAVGVLLKVAQSKINVNFNLELLLNAESADTEENSYKPCCHLETLEGSASTQLQFQTSFYGKFHVDYRNLKFAIHNQLTEQKVIILCDLPNACLGYLIYESQRNCSKDKMGNFSLDDAWIRCIPNNASSLGEMRFGSDEKQSSLLMRNWKFMLNGIRHQRLVTDVDCIPVIDFVSIDRFSSPIAQAFYFDIDKRIKDPSVFTPPPYCVGATDMNEDQKLQQLMFMSLFPTPK